MRVPVADLGQKEKRILDKRQKRRIKSKLVKPLLCVIEAHYFTKFNWLVQLTEADTSRLIREHKDNLNLLATECFEFL